jgi:hypothetical protein
MRVWILIADATIVALLFVGIALPTIIFRSHIYNMYLGKLDRWVADGGPVQSIEAEIVEPCGKIVLTQYGVWEVISLSDDWT